MVEIIGNALVNTRPPTPSEVLGPIQPVEDTEEVGDLSLVPLEGLQDEETTSVISSGAGKESIDKIIQDIAPADVETGLTEEEIRKRAEDQKAIDDAKKEEEPDVTTDLSLEDFQGLTEAEARQLFGTDFTGVIKNPDGTFTADLGAIKRIQEPTSATVNPNQPIIDETNAFYDDLANTLDASKRDQIARIKSQYNALRLKQEQANERRVRLQETIGVRFGGRFAIEHTADLVQEQINLGIVALNALASEASGLIADINNAFDEKSFSLALVKHEELKEIREARDKKLKEIEDAQLEGLKTMQEQLRRSTRDLTIADVLNQGINDPLQILGLLNFDEQGNRIGDFTAEEINDTVENLKFEKETTEIVSPNTQFIKLANGDYELRNKDTGELIKSIDGKKVESTGGNREDLTSFQILQARNLSAQIFGKRAGSKPENYGLVEDLLARGMTVDEIGDALRFSGQSEAFTGEFKSAFEFVTKTKISTADRIAARDGLDELLEADNISAAREFILGIARDKADTSTRQQVEGREDLLAAIDSIESGLKELKDKDISTGFLTGLTERALERGGFAVGTPEQNELANEIAIAIIDYRKSVSGAAFTESEAQAYEKVFPSTGKTEALDQAKINSLRRTANTRLDEFYERSIGSSYRAIMGIAPEEEEIPITTLEDARTNDVIEIDGVRYRKLSDGRFEEI